MHAARVSKVPPVNIIEFVAPFLLADDTDSVDFRGAYTKNDYIAVLHLRFFAESAKIGLFSALAIASAVIPFTLPAWAIQNDTPFKAQVHVFVSWISGSMLPKGSYLESSITILL